MEVSMRSYLPASHGICLSKKICPKTPKERKSMSEIPYASAMRSIIYVMLCIRPDVAYALGIASKFQTDLEEDHWKAMKNILKYLRRTKNIFLIYEKGSELKLEGYTDSNFQSDLDDSKSISGYIFALNGGAVSWKSFK